MPGRVDSPGSQGSRGSRPPHEGTAGPSNSNPSYDYAPNHPGSNFGKKGMSSRPFGNTNRDFRALSAVPAITATGANATDLITAAGHDYVLNTPVIFAGTSGATEIVVGTVYFVRDVSGATFKLAATANGAVFDFTTDLTAGTVQRVVTGVAATDLFSSAGHGLSNGMMVQLSVLTGGSGITAAANYTVTQATVNDFKLTQSVTGIPVLDFTTDLTKATLRRYG